MLDIDKKIDIELKDNERYQDLINMLYSLNQEMAELEHLRIEVDTERLNIEKQTAYTCKWGA